MAQLASSLLAASRITHRISNVQCPKDTIFSNQNSTKNGLSTNARSVIALAGGVARDHIGRMLGCFYAIRQL
ncbi:MAG TPA: hypothetical protein VGO93_15175, partial [Candidatus Xenobia bacterium]